MEESCAGGERNYQRKKIQWTKKHKRHYLKSATVVDCNDILLFMLYNEAHVPISTA